MRKSTEYAIGGAAFLVGGINMGLAPLLTGGVSGGDFLLLWATIPMAILLASVGAFWLSRAQGFYVAEGGRVAAPIAIQ